MSALANSKSEFQYFELTKDFKNKFSSNQNKDLDNSPLLAKAWKIIKDVGLKQANKLTEDILDYNHNFPLGRFNKPNLNWNSGINAGLGITVGRKVEPTLFETGHKWQVYDELNIHISAYAFLSEQRDLGKIKITDKNLGLYTGVFYTRKYNYIHFADSYLNGLTRKFDKLFLSFNYFRKDGFLKIAQNEVIQKSDHMTAKIGFAVQTPSVYFISGYGRGTIYSSKLSTLTYQKGQDERALRVSKLVEKPKGSIVQIGLQADFYGLLTLTLLGGEYRLDITKSTTSNMTLTKAQMDSIKKDQTLAHAFKELNNGRDPKKIERLKNLITSTENGNRITEEMHLFLLKWGKHKGSFTEDIVLETGSNKHYFFRHGQENVRLNKSWWDGIFSASKVNKYKSRIIKNMSFEYEALNPTTAFDEIHLDKNALVSFRVSKQFHAKKDGSYYRGRAIAMIEKFKNAEIEIINGLMNKTLRGPLTVDLHAQVGREGISHLMNMTTSELTTAFTSVCSSLDKCLKKLESKMAPLSHEYQTKSTISMYQLKNFLQSVTYYSDSLQDLKSIFGSENTQINGFLESNTKDKKLFKTYLSEGNDQGSGVIKDFIAKHN